eukprot:11195358-Lingulodinium_polyedra.AAC.1
MDARESLAGRLAAELSGCDGTVQSTPFGMADAEKEILELVRKGMEKGMEMQGMEKQGAEKQGMEK